MTLWLIPIAVLFTSAVSAALGMAGGLLLMGALVLLCAPALALALHGLLQLVSNGYRAHRLRRHVVGSVLLPYLVAALSCTLLLLGFRVLLDRRQMCILLGVVALTGSAIGRVARDPTQAPSPFWAADRPFGAALCGFVVTASNLTSGVGGPLLDVFFLRARLDRHAIVATKAVTQVFSHVLKLGYVALLAPEALAAPELSLPLLGAAVAATFVGTHLGGRVLDRLGERHFRVATRGVVFTIGLVYLARGFAAG